MELQALLVLCGVGVAGAAAVLLLMGLFSASGTSYEEAIAQQRKVTTELLALAESRNKAKKTNKKEKKEKKLAKKEKTKDNAGTTGTDPDSEAPAESGVEDESVPSEKPHVEFRPPVVVDVPRDVPPTIKIRKRGKDPKVKPILLNKEDPSCVSDPNTLPPTVSVSNHFEEMHPKDEFELLHTALATEKVLEKKEEPVEKKEAKPPKVAKVAKAASKQTSPVDPPKEVTPREQNNSGDFPKEQRKSKKVEKKQPAEDVADEVKEEVVLPLNAPHPSELTTEKLLKQALVPVVAAPTASPPAKGKKKKPEPNVLTLMAAGDGGGVNVGELVRVIREAALSRTEIQILTDALLNKHHDPLPEHSEWTEGPNDPMQKLKKQLADKEKALADEIEASQAVHAKLKELRVTLNSERGRAAAAAAAHRAELHTLQARLQRLVDENHALVQEKHVSESGLVQQLAALQAELNARLVELGQARMEVNAARDAMMISQQHAAEIAQQLQDANDAYGELEQQRQCAVHAEQLAQQELRQAQERLNASNELQSEVQRLTSRAQAAESNLDKLKEEMETQKQQLSHEISSLREQLAEKESELAELRQLKAAPAQNGLPSTDSHKAAELAKVESVVEALRGELAGAQAASRDQRDELTRLREQLSAYQLKNNELRTKNWKVMEALQSAEKALQTKSSSALPAQDALRDAIQKAQEAQYNEVATVLRTVCPSAAPGNKTGSDWLRAFADNLKKELEKRELEKKEAEKRAAEKVVEERVVERVVEKVVEKESQSSARLTDLEMQNEQLQGLVDKYKKIIDDTEGVLSRLQQNVTTEEQRWAQQLADKQRELDDLRTRTVLQMQNKIDSLQSELERAQASNHTNSFADAERLTQERLMGGLSEKRNVDVCNGPRQVGLEEK
ncbi:unnamed protein product [Diatraea saccharalis]|uniref:Ribosome-binding protein 1 n=1 Tax=Diatraea saccharalis TaxID=40085 RepID=A0A9N9R4E6_9NEOP|nr:unnamed protein product [Diatraea saccharalis]